MLRAVARYFRLPEDKFKAKRTAYPDERALAMELMHRYSGVSQAEIGKRSDILITARSVESGSGYGTKHKPRNRYERL